MAAIGMILCGLGILVLFSGVGIYALYQVYRGRKQADESASWQSTHGTVTGSSLGQSTNYSDSGPTVSYFPIVRYSYSVVGQPYTGERIAFGLGESSSRSAKAQKMLDGYPVGRPVTVYYDPANPAQAVLERRAGGGIGGLLIGIVFLTAGLCVGCAVTGMGLLLINAQP
jgi:uncharacterized protein DUF3592